MVFEIEMNDGQSQDGCLSAEDISALNKLTEAVESGAEIPPEAIRLLKKVRNI